MSPRFRFTVPGTLAGQRLDRCLAALHGEWSRSRVRRLIDGGLVTYNEGAAKPAVIVSEGDVVEVDEPPPRPLDVTAEPIPLVILFEDEHVLVLDKPADLVIHPAAGNPSGTLVNALLHHCSNLSGIGGVERPGIVHRLDKDTTGVMVVTKSDRAHLALSRAFSHRLVSKTYLALCYGMMKEPDTVIEAAIDRHPRERQLMAVRADGRPARTNCHLEEVLSGTSMVSCRPVTGRTHQIRVHLAHVGHAIVGDPLYAGRQWRNLADARVAKACRDFPRQALHAWRLAFDHPVSGAAMQFEAALPDDMVALLEVLRKASGATGE